MPRRIGARAGAVGGLPAAAIEAWQVPQSSGIRRAVLGKLPVPEVDVFHGLDADLPVSGPRAKVATIHDMSVFDTPWAYPAIRARGERLLVRDACAGPTR